jgi:hypothetical protein
MRCEGAKVLVGGWVGVVSVVQVCFAKNNAMRAGECLATDVATCWHAASGAAQPFAHFGARSAVIVHVAQWHQWPALVQWFKASSHSINTSSCNRYCLHNSHKPDRRVFNESICISAPASATRWAGGSEGQS